MNKLILIFTACLTITALAAEAPTVIKIKKAPFTESASHQDARLVPYIIPNSRGKVGGFRFEAVQSNSFYAQMGFKAKDIVTHIDDVKLDSPTNAMLMYNKLKDGNFKEIGL